MTGTLFSDATTLLSNHDRSTRQDSTSPHSDYHPHPSHSCFRQRPLSSVSVSILPAHNPPSQFSDSSLYSSSSSSSSSSLHEMSDRPTLPGIASILAFAGQHRPGFLASPPTSRSHPPSRLQSSDPIAHALPAFVAIPSVQKTQPMINHAPLTSLNSTSTIPSRNSRHRRRSSSVTVVNVANSTPTSTVSSTIYPPYPISTCAEPLKNPPLSMRPNMSSHSIHKLCHQPSQPYPGDTSLPSSGDRRSSSLRSSNSPKSSLGIPGGGAGLAEHAPQRRHSDRVTGPRSRVAHSVSSGRNTPSRQPSGLASDLASSRHMPFTATLTSPSPASDCTMKHIRRPSNASVSSSSSISCSASLSSDFGASLSIGSQANIHLHAAHLSSSSVPINSTLSSSSDQRGPQSLPTPPLWSREEDGDGHSRSVHRQMMDDHRRCDYNSQWDPHNASPPSNNSTADYSSFESPSNMSLSPEIISSGLSGSMMNTTMPTLGPQNHRYQCMEPGCGKTFSRPSSLKIHSYSHTGQKPFKCMRCDRAFSVQSNLKRHQKVHEKRSVGGPGRVVSGNGGSAQLTLMFERGSGRLIEEESAEEDHGSDQGMDDRMEE